MRGLSVVASLVSKVVIYYIFSIIHTFSVQECCEPFLFTPALATNQVKIVGEVLTVSQS